jgi:hypothetical protein
VEVEAVEEDRRWKHSGGGEAVEEDGRWKPQWRGDSGGGQIGLIIFWIMNINCKQRFLNSNHDEKQVPLAFATPAF